MGHKLFCTELYVQNVIFRHQKKQRLVTHQNTLSTFPFFFLSNFWMTTNLVLCVLDRRSLSTFQSQQGWKEKPLTLRTIVCSCAVKVRWMKKPVCDLEKVKTCWSKRRCENNTSNVYHRLFSLIRMLFSGNQLAFFPHLLYHVFVQQTTQTLPSFTCKTKASSYAQGREKIVVINDASYWKYIQIMLFYTSLTIRVSSTHLKSPKMSKRMRWFRSGAKINK